MVRIMGHEFELQAHYREGNFDIYILLKSGDIAPHSLTISGEKCRLFRPLGNSLPAEEIELQSIIDEIRREMRKERGGVIDAV